jgi:hypothetical protein
MSTSWVIAKPCLAYNDRLIVDGHNMI